MKRVQSCDKALLMLIYEVNGKISFISHKEESTLIMKMSWICRIIINFVNITKIKTRYKKNGGGTLMYIRERRRINTRLEITVFG